MKKVCNDFLMEQFGDQDVVNEIYDEYAKSVKEKIAEADTVLSSFDWTALDRIAHAVKGNALAVGDNDVANVAIVLRNAAKLSDEAEAAALIEKLKELVKEI